MTTPKPDGWMIWHPEKEGWVPYNRYIYNKLPHNWRLKRFGEGYVARPVMLVPPSLIEWVEKAKQKLSHEANFVTGQDSRDLLAELEEIEKGMG